MRPTPTKTVRKGLPERLATANRFLNLVAGCGRRFFYARTTDKVASFTLRKGLLYYQPPYAHSRDIFLHYTPKWGNPEYRFGEGGTMWSLVQALRGYIRFNEPFPLGHLGPTPSWMVGNGDVWGYGQETMETLRQQTRALLTEV